MTLHDTIGIDFGASNTSVSVWREGKAEVIVNEFGSPFTPSVVAFTESECLIGELALAQLGTNPANTIVGIKHLLGKKFSDESVQSLIPQLSYKVKCGENDAPEIEVQFKGQLTSFTAETIASMILAKMKLLAESHLSLSISKAVITIPACDNDALRQATKLAAELTGLEVLKIFKETMAVGFAYGQDKCVPETNVIIIDHSGVLKATILTIEDEVFEVKATVCDSKLGGDEFDARIANYCIDSYKLDQSNLGPQDKYQLYSACEEAKKTLSSSMQATVNICIVEAGDVAITISRGQFESFCEDMFERLRSAIDVLLHESGVSMNSVQKVMLVGGSTRIPKVKQVISEIFDGKQILSDIDPQAATCIGAATLAYCMVNVKPVIGCFFELLILPLGIETSGGVMTPILPRGITMASRRSLIITTNVDHQTDVEIKIFEGERAVTNDCHLLGTLNLSGIVPALRGVPKIEVTFELDVNGNLTATAEEFGTGNRNYCTIRNDRGRLSLTEFQHMIREAEMNVKADDILRRKFYARNNLESCLLSLRCASMDKSSNLANRNILEAAWEDSYRWVKENEGASEQDFTSQLQLIIDKFKSATGKDIDLASVNFLPRPTT